MAIQRQMGKVAIKTEEAPTLTSGTFEMTFGDYEKVVQAAVFLEGPQTSDRVFEATYSTAANVVSIWIKKMQVSATNTWGDAVTGDVDAETITVIADVI